MAFIALGMSFTIVHPINRTKQTDIVTTGLKYRQAAARSYQPEAKVRRSAQGRGGYDGDRVGLQGRSGGWVLTKH